MPERKLLVVRQVPREDLGRIRGLASTLGVPFTVADRARPSTLPKDASDLRGLVLLGGPMSAGDDASDPFLARAYRVLRDALDRDLPVLGICLGAQMLARAAGGRVAAGPGPEIGHYRLSFTREAEDDLVCGPLGGTPAVFQWHYDGIELPPGALRLAHSALYPVQAFRIGRRAWGLQFHPEATPEMIAAWAPEFRRELWAAASPARWRDVASTAERLEPEIGPRARASLESFLRVV